MLALFRCSHTLLFCCSHSLLYTHTPVHHRSSIKPTPPINAHSVAKICESDPECSKETMETILNANPLMRNNFENKSLEGIKSSRFHRLAFITGSPVGNLVAKPFKVFGAGIMAIGSKGDVSINKVNSQFRRSSLSSHFATDDGWEGDVEDNGGRLFTWENGNYSHVEEDVENVEEDEDEKEEIEIRII